MSCSVTWCERTVCGIESNESCLAARDYPPGRSPPKPWSGSRMADFPVDPHLSYSDARHREGLELETARSANVEMCFECQAMSCSFLKNGRVLNGLVELQGVWTLGVSSSWRIVLGDVILSWWPYITRNMRRGRKSFVWTRLCWLSRPGASPNCRRISTSAARGRTIIASSERSCLSEVPQRVLSGGDGLHVVLHVLRFFRFAGFALDNNLSIAVTRCNTLGFVRIYIYI